MYNSWTFYLVFIKVFTIFVILLRNTQCFRWHLGLLFREVKRPKLLNEQTIGTLNAHALWRGCAYVRMGTWSSLLPIGTTHVSFYRYSPDFKLNGCYLTAMTLLIQIIV